MYHVRTYRPRVVYGVMLLYTLLCFVTLPYAYGHNVYPPLEMDGDEDGLCDICEQMIFKPQWMRTD